MRLVVFDRLVTEERFQKDLETLFPDTAFERGGAWHFSNQVYKGVPLWSWTDSLETLQDRAKELLHEFVYPMIVHGSEFCLSFPFAPSAFAPKALDLTDEHWIRKLDLEDIGRLLLSDAMVCTYELLPQIQTPVNLTPIEERLAKAMAEAGIPARPQVKLGRYRVDFLIETPGRRLVVEADGYAYHDRAADRSRDQALLGMGVDQVLRFSGREIYRDAPGCAQAIRRCLSAKDPAAPRPLSLETLDASQKGAVAHGSGPARVLAPAGSGKTRTMVNRVLELLNRGVHPSAILVLAFNKKAASQLLDWLGGLGVPVARKKILDGAGVVCATFNAFGYRYQREVLDLRLEVEARSSRWRDLMDKAVQASGTDLRSMKLNRGSDPLGTFLKALDDVKADLRIPESIEVELETYDTQKPRLIPFAPIFEEFQRLQLSKPCQSFDDQIYITVRDLLLNPPHRERLQTHFSHILVDEFQDLNAAQLALVEILSRPHRQLFVVGDDDQLIYGWRFAKPTNILEFHQRVPPPPYSATYTLSTNYRCSKAIVEASRRLIDHNRQREPKPFGPHASAPPGRVQFVASDAWSTRARAVVEFLQTEKQRLDCKWQSLAVLCRYKAQQLMVAMALDQARIPRTPLLSYRLFTHPAAELLRAYLDLVLSPTTLSANHFRFIINRPNRYIRQAEVDHIARQERPWEYLQQWLPTDGVTPRAIPDFIRRTEMLHRRFHSDTVTGAELLAVIRREFDLDRVWTDERQPKAVQDADEADPRQILDLLTTWAADIPSPAALRSEWESLAEKETRHFDMEEDTLDREASPEEDRVIIATMHASKGREYASVVIVDYHPSAARMTEAEIEEERRVLYVGVTRAREAVLLTVDTAKGVHPYIKELIQPATGPKERETIQEELTRAQTEERTLAGRVARCRITIEAIQSGQELRQCAADRAEIQSKIKALRPEVDALAVQRQVGGLKKLWMRIIGDYPQLVAKYEQRRATLDALMAQDEALAERETRLRTEPDSVAREYEQQIQAAEQQRVANQEWQANLSSRLRELELLGES